MNAKEYLCQVFYLNREIDENLLEIEELESKISKCSQTFSNIPQSEHNGNSTEIKLTDYIDERQKLENEINDEIDRLDKIKSEIRKRILKIRIPKYRLVLLKRYCRFLKWEQIQEEMGYEDVKSATRIHRKAIEEFIKIHGNIF